ncbi:hypothetical protein DFH08DRAFT_795200 [Mycena albidolilacea]|uniref:CxC5 like cysteine cluster associated with KDZ domain-containing protein n=1 Tax=Mycena albidolilacea TaxID=1033008 RepID=A0AAD6YXN9_9AGAR|nr:hypothetical protein DFH08DRAFT_795200 [Mycena albidolilacea]
MAVSVYNFIVFLQVFFPGGLSMQRTLYVIAILASIYPLFRLHRNQHREPRQPPATGWYRSILLLLSRAFHPERNDPELWLDEGPGDEYAQAMCDDLGQLYEFLGIPGSSAGHNNFFPEPRTILVTSRLTCIFCPASDGIYSLRRRRKVSTVRLLDSNFRWVKADLFIAYCRACDAEYYPDRITYRLPNQPRRERLEYGAKVLRVSKHGVWMDRRIAFTQENSILRFHSGWSNFAEWLSDTVGAKPRVTPRQSQRLYFEHFARRLISTHGLAPTFSLPSNSSSQVLADTVREQIGLDGGVVAGAMEHGCMDCTHLKRYKSDLVATGASLGDRIDGIADDLMENQNVPATLGEEMPPPPMQTGIPSEPEQQEFPPQNGCRGYVCLAVMDGKTIKHKICSVDLCHKPLVNYKNGRFCEDHLDLRDICGIVPCGRAVHSSGAFTCDNAAHKDWHVKYLNRFSRMSFPGVQRVIRRQLGGESRFDGQSETEGGGPSLRAELPDLNGVAGAQVSHTFRAGTTYCLQTIQWSCGCPIAWGKCYRSESSSQVLAFLNRTWEHHPNSKPSFIAYDDACNLLRHIVTQDANSPWIRTTKFIVDAWHYIGHRATDVLCRLWCNPAPTNGSQPDLVLVDVDDNGRTHTTRAFNTETAEQLNAWLNGFEAQLRQMSATNYDFCVHVLMFLYKEMVEERILKKQRTLSDEFWGAVEEITREQ